MRPQGAFDMQQLQLVDMLKGIAHALPRVRPQAEFCLHLDDLVECKSKCIRLTYKVGI